MRWPWTRSNTGDQLVVSWAANTLSYVRARPRAGGGFEVTEAGVQVQGDDNLDDFVRRLQALGLKGMPTTVMLRPEQYQFLQIDAPAVAPEELRSAARYLIRDMVQTHLDDITLDVMRVGDGQHTGTAHLFVVATTNAVARQVLDLAELMHWQVSVIDVQETVQRNLQNANAKGAALTQTANAALVVVQGHQAVLTISANEELFYTRRFELPEGLMTAPWGQVSDSGLGAIDAFTPVEEYVPGYATPDYGVSSPEASAGVGADDGLQRLVVEVQRSLDLWDRTWVSKPLSGLRLYAGERTAELAQNLGRQLGQNVGTLDMGALFAGWSRVSPSDQAACMPLLGALLRTESRKL